MSNEISANVGGEMDAKSVQRSDFKSLQRLFKSHNVSKQDIDDLKSFIEDDDTDREKKKFGKKVSNWIGKVFTKAVNGTWKIDPPKAAKMLAEGIAAYYGF